MNLPLVLMRGRPADLPLARELADCLPPSTVRVSIEPSGDQLQLRQGYLAEVVLPTLWADDGQFLSHGDAGVSAATTVLVELEGRPGWLPGDPRRPPVYAVGPEDVEPLTLGLLAQEIPLSPTFVDQPQALLLGASAGGVDAFERLARTLPEAVQLPVVMMLHRRSSIWQDDDLWLRRLGQSCGRPVVVAKDGAAVEPGRLYLAPGGIDTEVAAGPVFRLRADDTSSEPWCPSINRLFNSAAAVWGSGAIGVVLSGMLSDGAAGLRQLTAGGGVTLAQDPSEARAPGMPLQAVAQDHPSYVFELDDFWTLIERIIAPLPRAPTVPTSLVLTTARRALRLRHWMKGPRQHVAHHV